MIQHTKHVDVDGDHYKCVLSLGIRCFTEIYLRNLNFKMFSSPFDGLYLSTTNDIINLLENHITDHHLEHTEDLEEFKSCNETWGFRTLHNGLDNILLKNNNNTENRYHLATFAHHNLKKTDVRNHFNKAFQRFDIIQKNRIRTLFCLFIHPNYYNYVNISMDSIDILSNYLLSKYNFHLLVIYFAKMSNQEQQSPMINKIKETNNYTIYNINNDSIEFIEHQHTLHSIFKTFGIEENKLLKYEDFQN